MGLPKIDFCPEPFTNLAKLGDGLDESPTVMVGDKTKKQFGKNRDILKPRWAFVETKN